MRGSAGQDRLWRRKENVTEHLQVLVWHANRLGASNHRFGIGGVAPRTRMVSLAALNRFTKTDIRPSGPLLSVEIDCDADLRVVLRVSCRSMTLKEIDHGPLAIAARHKIGSDLVQSTPDLCTVLSDDIDHAASPGIAERGISPLPPLQGRAPEVRVQTPAIKVRSPHQPRVQPRPRRYVVLVALDPCHEPLAVHVRPVLEESNRALVACPFHRSTSSRAKRCGHLAEIYSFVLRVIDSGSPRGRAASKVGWPSAISTARQRALAIRICSTVRQRTSSQARVS